MKKATFAIAALFTAKAFTTKLNFVAATAKKLNIKKADALTLADSIENGTDGDITPNDFKRLFVTAATKMVADKMLNAIVPTKLKGAVNVIVAELAADATRPAKRDAKSPATKRKAAAKAKKLVVVAD